MQVLDLPQVVPAVDTPQVRWSGTTRIAFRFCFSYFGLYVLVTQMLQGLVLLPIGPPLEALPPLRNVTEWTAMHVFGVTTPLVIFSGSGDKTFDWVLASCLLVIAVAATAIWSYADRRRQHYTGMHKWFRLFLRFALGATLVSYGTVKVVPLQMPSPGLTRLLEPFGHFSPMGVLWASIGASRPYEIFAGCVELAAGILLLVPGTATLGAVVAFCALFQVFMLNMTYDVPVKLFSFHLVLMALFLLAPDARRLLSVLVLNRPARAPGIPPIGATHRARRIALVAQLLLGLYIVGMNLNNARDGWYTYGGGAPKSPLYGIWQVAYLSISGVERAPLVTDYDRWRRVIFERPTSMAFQRMDDTFAWFGTRIDVNAKTLVLTAGPQQTQRGTFSFERPAPDRLTLTGEFDGAKVRMRLELFDRHRFLLVTRGFHWVQEYPFNR